jgi:hypothetical protein
MEIASLTPEDAPNSRWVYPCPGCKTRIPYGTEKKPPPDSCPTCQRGRSIPTVLQHEGRPILVSHPPSTHRVLDEPEVRIQQRQGLWGFFRAILRMLKLTKAP